MIQYNIHQAKTNLSKLIAQVENGEEIIIARAGKPIVKIEKYQEPPQKKVKFSDIKPAFQLKKPLTRKQALKDFKEAKQGYAKDIFGF
mgnify:CR=1 FL=1